MRRKKTTAMIPQDGVVAQALAHIDSLLDRISHNKLKEFDATTVEQLRRLDASDLKSVKTHYLHSWNDIKSALDGDEYCLEAYSNFDAPQMKLALKLLKEVRALKPDAKQNGKKLGLGRFGPRRRKQKSPDKIVKKVLYLPQDEETGFTSRNPEELVGADQLWVYNTKTRKLGCYYAQTMKGLTAKGTTVVGYNTERSTQKTIRKPKEQLQAFLAGQLKYEEIRAVPQPISPRLHRETLILKVLTTNLAV